MVGMGVIVGIERGGIEVGGPAWEIYSTNFSADLAAVGLLRLRIQF